MDSENCFTCGEKPVKFFAIINYEDDSKLNISLILCQHFWFQADDLRNAIICESCWDKVEAFHRFYQEVKTLKEDQLDSKPLSIFIKQEEVEIDEQLLREHFLDVALEIEKPFDDVVECKPETKLENADTCEKASVDTESSCSTAQKLRRSSKIMPTSKVSKSKIVRKPVQKRNRLGNRHICPKQQKVEDDYIKQHRSYVCEECHEEFEDFITIRRHSAKHHGKGYIICCENQYRTRSGLYEHVQRVLNPKVVSCEICNRTFKFESGYIRHKEEIHPEEHQLIFKCDRCPKSFPKQKMLKRHITEHETYENGDAKCNVCGKCFRTQIRMRRHAAQVHEKNFEFICEVCSKGFMKRSELTAHLQYHDLTADQMKKQCPICNKWMKNLRYWKKHVERHKQAGSYKCDQCSHVSINSMSLKLHIERRHGPNVKKYACELCGKEYSRPITLKEHIANAHTGEPLYACPFCEKKFFSNATMYSHRKKDHPEEWLEEFKAKFASADQGAGGGGN